MMLDGLIGFPSNGLRVLPPVRCVARWLTEVPQLEEGIRTPLTMLAPAAGETIIQEMDPEAAVDTGQIPPATAMDGCRRGGIPAKVFDLGLLPTHFFSLHDFVLTCSSRHPLKSHITTGDLFALVIYHWV
ncbi:hypothetical protein DXG03_003648 [Asterophora parasitica]|uniref:Uncharacterized protein n=1 Tax=Asterophora parasitica TaxID=117018 RepID=A0A9P7G7B7_9AGAR|nr:hypothetical protein DXG03_003648 [Asterophora parasitica]